MSRRGPLRLFDRLGFRLAFLLAVALFPLLVLAIMQSRSMLSEAQARSEAALMGETLRAVSGITRLIQQAEAQSNLLSDLVPSVMNDDAACSALMRQAKAANPHASFVGFTRLDGVMRCSSDGRIADLSASPRFHFVAEQDDLAYTVAESGAVSGTSVLTISYPVRDAAGARIGFVSISLPHQGLDGLEKASRMNPVDHDKPLVILTFDKSGKVLTASDGLENAESQIPALRDLSGFNGRQAVSFMATSRGGERRIYSVVDLIPEQLYALGSWPAKAVPVVSPITQLPPILFPALMWAASLFVAYFAMQKMVIGHVKRLSRALRSFASGNRIVAELDVDGAPREIRDLAENYAKMTETILHDEAELEDTIHHKEVLLREVHHRVKNNLQLIASIINMQVRRARTPEAKAMMKGLQERVISLATVHRGLYMTSGLTDIDANELIRDIARQLMRATTGPDRQIATEIHIDDIRLTPDQAVPLSLLLTEAMTNAVKYASADSATPRLSVTLEQCAPMRARLSIRNTVATSGPRSESADEASSGLGSQLLNAFVQQIGGTLSLHDSAGTYAVIVEFNISPLAEAELRHQEATAGP